SLDVDGQLEFCRLEHRQIGRLLTLENTADIGAHLTERVLSTSVVAHQTPGRDAFTTWIHHGNRMSSRQCDEEFTPSAQVRIVGEEECADWLLRQSLEGDLDLPFGAGFQDVDLQPE